MRHNIIAVIVFIAFIAGAWFAGYKISDNQTPFAQYSEPQYGQTTYRETARTTNNDFAPLQTNRPTTTSKPTTTSRPTTNYQPTQITSSSYNLTINQTSGSQTRSYGSGQNITTNSSGGNSGNTSNPTGSPTAIIHRLPQQTTIKTAANQLNTQQIETADHLYSLHAADENDDPGDPFREPVGELPLALLLILTALRCHKTYRTKNTQKR